MNRAIFLAVLSLSLAGCSVANAYARRIDAQTVQMSADAQYKRDQEATVWAATWPAYAVISVIGVAGALGIGLYGFATITHATQQAAHIQARIIRPRGGSLPALMSRDGNYATVLNTNQVTALNAPREADRYLVAGDNGVRLVQAGYQRQLVQHDEEMWGDG
jgi:ABC-type taurine transport system substrate-binding protein